MSGKHSVWTKVFRLFASATWLLIAVAGFVAPAEASTHFVATGTSLYQPPPPTVVHTADGNVFMASTAPLVYSGDVAGTASIVQTFVMHKDGSFNGHATETCANCTIGGRTGAYAANVTFSGLGPNFTGHETIHGSGALAGLHCQGVFSGSLITGLSDYSYDCNFE